MLRLKFSSVILLMLLCETWVTSNPFYENPGLDVTEMEDDKASLYCDCGYPDKAFITYIDIKAAEYIFPIIAESRWNVSESTEQWFDIFNHLSVCQWCQLAFTACYSNPNFEDEYSCFRKTAYFHVKNIQSNKEDDSKTKLFPKVIHVPVGGLSKNRRQIRAANTCGYPKSLRTSEIHCIHYPSSVNCTQRCAFGYTLENGIKQDLQCVHKENKWKPSGFKECEPFIDCSTTLVSGGSMSCNTPSHTRPPKCNVECLHYEDKPAIARESYVCNIEGKWEPPLPFCVTQGSGLALVKAPTVKLPDA